MHAFFSERAESTPALQGFGQHGILHSIYLYTDTLYINTIYAQPFMQFVVLKSFGEAHLDFQQLYLKENAN